VRRRLHLDDLRTSDASTIQVLYGDALGRPLGQLAPATLLDLLAISELDDLPKPMKRDLAAFAERISRAVADLPDGPTWDEFIAEYGAESPTRVPTTFRLLIDRESTREARSPTSRQGAVDLLSTWAGIEPQEVVLRAKATTPTVRADTAPPTGKRTRKPRKAARRAAPKPEVDPDRQEWIKKVGL